MTRTLRDEDITDDVKDLWNEVQKEEDVVQLSAKLRELHSLVEPYTVKDGAKLMGQYPLEVRLNNFTYTVVTVESGGTDKGGPKIQTVYNASCVYSGYKWLRRVSKCKPSRKMETPRKHVLQNINLVIQPGKQYLVLGPPGSGKSTLLKTVAGLLRDDETRSVQGGITYNGRALEVSTKSDSKSDLVYVDTREILNNASR
jgi:ABC-type multidrug transport system fused ATPase/permease subunit